MFEMLVIVTVDNHWTHEALNSHDTADKNLKTELVTNIVSKNRNNAFAVTQNKDPITLGKLDVWLAALK